MKLTTLPQGLPDEDPVVAEINRHNDAFAEFTYAGIKSLNKSFWAFWRGTVEEVVERLNKLGVVQVIQAGQDHNPSANVVNELIARALDGRPADFVARFPDRAITAPAMVIDWGMPLPEGVTAAIRLVDHMFVEGQLVGGVFEVVPEPEPEPEE
jgi:hypothetical protein